MQYHMFNYHSIDIVCVDIDTLLASTTRAA